MCWGLQEQQKSISHRPGGWESAGMVGFRRELCSLAGLHTPCLGSFLVVTLNRGLISLWRTPPSMTFRTSQRPHLLIPSQQGGQGFHIWIEGTQTVQCNRQCKFLLLFCNSYYFSHQNPRDMLQSPWSWQNLWDTSWVVDFPCFLLWFDLFIPAATHKHTLSHVTTAATATTAQATWRA